LTNNERLRTFLDRETARIDELIGHKERLIELLEEKRRAVISHAVTRGLDPTVPLVECEAEWLAEMPAHWTVRKVKHIARRERGAFIDGDWIESPYITDDGIRLIQCGNVGTGVYEEQGYRYISEDTFRELNCTDISPGDVLICGCDHPPGFWQDVPALHPIWA
jgi:type I restriction enzyme S subunit